MKVMILEDERPALEHLRAALGRCAPHAELTAAAASVHDAVAWLRANPAPDLILADIELGDGLSLRVFDQVAVRCPVVFCTAYDEYVTEAFRCNGIDYLLKPIDDAALARALERYRQLEDHFAARLAAASAALTTAPTRHRERVVARRGAEHLAVPVDDIAYFAVEDGVVVLIHRDGHRYLCDRALGELEAELDPRAFFRANRQLLVRYSAVRSFRSHTKGRLSLTLDPPGPNAIVSQENARPFRHWLGGDRF